MRNLLPLLLIFIIGCSTPDKKQQQIKDHIIKNAQGIDIKYTPVSTEVVAQVKIKESLNNLMGDWNYKVDKAGIDSAFIMVNWIIENGRKNDKPEEFNTWTFYKKRLERLTTSNPDSTDYQVLKHTYTIINPLFNNAKVTVTNYYYFTGTDSLLGSVDELSYKEYKSEYIKFPTQKNEVALYNMQK